MPQNITIDVNVRTAKASTNVKHLTGDTISLKTSVDRLTSSTNRHTGATQRNEKSQDNLKTRLKRLEDIYDSIIHSKKELNKVDVQRAQSIQKEIAVVKNQISSNQKAVAGQVSGFQSIKSISTSTLGKAGLIGLYGSAGFAAASTYRKMVLEGSLFQDQLADLEAITGITGDRLKDLSDQALELSVTYGRSAANIIEANKLVASQLAEKIDFNTQEGAEELAKVSEEAIVLSISTGSLETAVKTVTTAINQFNLEASETPRIINSIAAGSKYGAAEAINQAEAYKQAGSVAAGANLSFEQLNATVQVLAANAIVGSQAGTNIRGVLLSLQNSSKLAEAGIHGVSLETQGYIGTLQALSPLLEDSVALEKLFGRENIASARILIENAQAVEEMTEKVTGGNVAYEQAAVKMNTRSAAQERMAAAINTVLIPAFERENGVTVQLINGTTELIKQFGGGLDVINDWVAGLNRLSQARGTLVTLVDTYTDWIVPLRLAKASLRGLGIIESKEEYEELFKVIDQGNQTIEDQVSFLSKNVAVMIRERSELEQGTEAWSIFNAAIDDNIGKLQSSRSQFASYLEHLKAQRDVTEEGSFEYAELTEKINQAELAISSITDSLTTATDARNEANQALEGGVGNTDDVNEAATSLSATYKKNHERIQELITATHDLSQAEWSELHSLNEQNKSIKEQIALREELAGLGPDLRPDVENPEAIHVPIELDTSALDEDVFGGLEGLETPLKSMDEILEELNKDVAEYIQLSNLLGDNTNDVEYSINRTTAALEELLANGYHPQSQEVEELVGKLGELRAKQTELQHIEQQVEAQEMLTASIGRNIASQIQYAESVQEGARGIIKSIINEIVAKSILAAFNPPTPGSLILAPILAAVANRVISAAIPGFAEGGEVGPVLAREGYAYAERSDKRARVDENGMIRGPGTGTSDSILARVSNGEFITNAQSTSAARSTLTKMNKSPRYAAQVQALVSKTPGFSVGGEVRSVRVADSIINRELSSGSSGNTQIIQNTERLEKAIKDQTSSLIENERFVNIVQEAVYDAVENERKIRAKNKVGFQ